MNTRPSIRPFPIPVVAHGLQAGTAEDDAPEYTVLPRGMATYQAPRLPEPESLAGRQAARQVLARVLAAVQAAAGGQAVAPISLAGLGPADLDLVNQVLGEGEVSAQVLADEAQGSVQGSMQGHVQVQVQESVFAGVWRVLHVGAAGEVRQDHVEVAAVPAVLLQAARNDAAGPAIAPLPPPPGVMNAPALLVELADQRLRWRAGQPAHVVNLSLLPVGPADIAYLDHHLGTGRVVVLSRGYGNCRITNTRVAHTWRVVYYNSQDHVILNAVEVTAMPDVVCAAPQDLADSAERLAEVLQWVAQA